MNENNRITVSDALWMITLVLIASWMLYYGSLDHNYFTARESRWNAMAEYAKCKRVGCADCGTDPESVVMP